ncbi:MAG: hypothetical protein Q8Q25_01235 [bacterium]|nr:hypothetical protein [bacterium]
MDDRGLYDIYGIWHQPFWQTRTFLIIVLVLSGVLILGFFGFMLRWILKRRKKRLLPWQRALHELDRLKQQKMVTIEQAKQLYSGVSIVFKSYFHERYHFDLYGKTDQEMLFYLKQRDFPADLMRDIEQVLLGGQMVKFAGQRALQEVIERHFNICTTIIMRTIPEEKQT